MRLSRKVRDVDIQKLARHPLAAILFLILLGVAFFPNSQAQGIAGAVTGNVFLDVTGDGIDSGQFDPGLQNIVVVATDENGVVTNATTDANGDYSVPVATGARVRLEFALPADGSLDFLSPGRHGAGSGTTVMFANEGDENINTSFWNPAEYCEANPDIVAACFVAGDPTDPNGPSASADSIVSIPFDAQGDGTDPNDPASALVENIATADSTGSIWGMAWNRTDNVLYSAAFLKRHVGFGPDGIGAIYAYDANTQQVNSFIDLVALGFDVGQGSLPATNAARGLQNDSLKTSLDADAYPNVGKVGLGSIDVDDADEFLYATNLFGKVLYKIELDADGNPGTAPVAGDVQTFAIPDPGCSNGEHRPFAVKYYQTRAYVGLICDASGSNTAADLEAYVVVLDEDTSTFSSVLNFPLNYDKGLVWNSGYADCDDQAQVNWHPWNDTFANSICDTPLNATVHVYPSPIFSDIEFDDDGSLIMGLMDRTSHQIGWLNVAPDYDANAHPNGPDDEDLNVGLSGGDILRAYKIPGAGWELESNGQEGPSSPRPATAGANNGQGPGGGEFYYQDITINNNIVLHSEAAFGSVILIPGSGEVAYTSMNAYTVGTNSGGIMWSSNTDGTSRDPGFLLYNAALEVGFGKANGLGGVEAFCGAAPLEVGNRIWIDTDQDGIQDPDELGLDGVVVELWRDGVQVGTVTTTDSGQYYFDVDPNVIGEYEIRIDVTQTALQTYTLTQNDAATNDAIDSDATQNDNFATIPFDTGKPGENNHTLDAGFHLSPTATPEPTATETATATNTVAPPTETPPTVAPTETFTNTPEPTATATDVPTNTPEPTETATEVPTNTPEPTATETATNTPEPTETATDVPTNTPEPTATGTDVPTNTPEPTETATEAPTNTPEPTATVTEVPTNTPEPTATATDVPTNTPEPTATETATNTPVPTSTPTNTPGPAISLVKTVANGHVGIQSCPASELITANNGDPVTYCFLVTNTGNTHLTNVTLRDPILGIDVNLSVSAFGGAPLAPGGTFTYVYQGFFNEAWLTLDSDGNPNNFNNVATVVGTPTDPDGVPTGQPDVTDDDDANVQPEATPTPTNTATLVPTNTNTPVPTNTATLVPTSTNTPVPTSTATTVPTSTNTPVPTGTVATETPTSLPSNTPTSLPSNTPTSLPSNTPTSLPSNTPTGTIVATATATPVATETPTPGPTVLGITPTPTQQPFPGVLLEKTVAKDHIDVNDCPGVEVLNAQVGDDISYCFKVTNTGNTYLDSIVLRDPLLGVSIVLNDAVNGGQPIAPGEMLFYVYHTTLMEEWLTGDEDNNDFKATNLADVDAKPTDPDGTPTGQPNVWDTDTAMVTIKAPLENDPATVIKRINVDGELKVESVATRGEQIKYQIEVVNGNATAIDNIILTDVLPQYVSYVSSDVTKGTATYNEAERKVEANIGTLGANESATLTIMVQVDEDAPLGEILRNLGVVDDKPSNEVETIVIPGEIPDTGALPVGVSIAVAMIAVIGAVAGTAYGVLRRRLMH